MKTGTTSTDFVTRAHDALRAVLARVSAIRLLEFTQVPPPVGASARILVRIDIYGHSHTLACDLYSDSELSSLRAAFRESRAVAAALPPAAVPVVIAPYLSPETQAICKENQVGFFDFEGNARLTVGDFFIVMRSMPRVAATRVSTVQLDTPALAAVDPLFPNMLPKVPRKQPPLALSA